MTLWRGEDGRKTTRNGKRWTIGFSADHDAGSLLAPRAGGGVRAVLQAALTERLPPLKASGGVGKAKVKFNRCPEDRGGISCAAV